MTPIRDFNTVSAAPCNGTLENWILCEKLQEHLVCVAAHVFAQPTQNEMGVQWLMVERIGEKLGRRQDNLNGINGSETNLVNHPTHVLFNPFLLPARNMALVSPISHRNSS